MKVSSGGSIAFVFSLLSLQSPLQSPCSTSNPSSPIADRSLVLVPTPHAALQGPQSDQFFQLRFTSVPPLDLLLRHVPGTPLQAPGCEQQPGKAVWSTIHSSPRHSRPLVVEKFHRDNSHAGNDKGDYGDCDDNAPSALASSPRFL